MCVHLVRTEARWHMISYVGVFRENNDVLISADTPQLGLVNRFLNEMAWEMYLDVTQQVNESSCL